jgi:hypothetical protein
MFACKLNGYLSLDLNERGARHMTNPIYAPKNLAEFVPEIYYDLIARIVPAAMALTPYLWPVRLQPLSLFSGLIFLCFSYFLGYIADVASRAIVKPLLRSISGVISRTTGVPLKYRRSRELLSLLSQVPPDRHSTMKKLLAESTMLLVASTLCMTMAVFPPPAIPNPHAWRRWLAIAAVLLVLGHVDTQILALARINGERDAASKHGH